MYRWRKYDPPFAPMCDFPDWGIDSPLSWKSINISIEVWDLNMFIICYRCPATLIGCHRMPFKGLTRLSWSCREVTPVPRDSQTQRSALARPWKLDGSFGTIFVPPCADRCIKKLCSDLRSPSFFHSVHVKSSPVWRSWFSSSVSVLLRSTPPYHCKSLQLFSRRPNKF